MRRGESGQRLAVALILSAVLTACAGGRTVRQELPSPASDAAKAQAVVEASPPAMWDLVFPEPLLIPQHVTVSDPTDPKALVTFALMLVEKKEFQRAASFFLEVTDLPSAASHQQAFRIATLAAAASCLLQARDMVHFHKVVQRLQGEMDRFQAAALPPELAMLLAIDAQRRGGLVHLNSTLPFAVQYLFHDEK